MSKSNTSFTKLNILSSFVHKYRASSVHKTMMIAMSLFLSTASPVQAAGGENVALNFSSSDQITLYVSLGFGILSLLIGLFVSMSVLKQSSGSKAMQDVSSAIKDGAMAYLKKQVSVMSLMVVLLAIGLFGLYQGTYGFATALKVSLTFTFGVAASYLAGYIGMLMAVNGNVRTAHAAITSYKLSLETAFRSGSVAGLATVGMGLIGASLIFLLGGNDAVLMLVGFGFGGSLAALFMRVGGGIYTKAADVGADLVGKVEAGIPEDDPRNPATIADNVGDNVGDCAGMAADVFESYVVTLLAAIVLGAATSEIFDQSIWMKLVLFPFMIKGIGIIASIAGILTFSGKEDLNSDPLSSIRSGFKKAVIVCLLGSGVASWYMFDGQKNGVTTDTLTHHSHIIKSDLEQVLDVKHQLAKHHHTSVDKITVDKLINHPKIKEAKLSHPDMNEYLNYLVSIDSIDKVSTINLKDYQKVNPDGSDTLLESYSVPTQKNGKDLQFINLGQMLKNNEIKCYHVGVKQNSTEKDGKLTQAPKENFHFLIQSHDAIQKLIDSKNTHPNASLRVIKKYDVHPYVGKNNTLLLAVSGLSKSDLRKGIEPMQILRGTSVELQKLYEEAVKNKSYQPLQQRMTAVDTSMLEFNTIAWWRFYACIVFGIFMAFAIELLTDYYVSTKRKPVQEVAGVSTAGAAPMLIQGFSYAQESSVFSVFTIVASLIAPMVIFPPAEFGGYILSLYGIALVGLGLLSTTGYILAMDTFGPISDNAQGVFEMSGAGKDNPEAARAVGLLDAAGNTTKALTKGFAIATAVVASIALFQSYIKDTHLENIGIQANVPEIFMGILLGGATPYLFSAFSISAVGRAAFHLIAEVRRQFKADPGIMEGTSKPNYGKCVEIVTAAAQKELLGPAILAIFMPIAVGFGFSIGKDPVLIAGERFNLVGAQALGGFLIGAIVSGQLLAVFLANAGGMWDNAKKLIEDGFHGGKGSEAHKASVVCDTVGDPFKDTAGPALNPLIKVMNLVAVLLAPIIVQPLGTSVLIGVTGISILFLIGAMAASKKGSMSEHFNAMNQEKES